VWADHGDTVSNAYAGTGALKADYTRTGKRTREGALHDGYKSVMRYVRNNFFDGDRQVGSTRYTPGWYSADHDGNQDAFDILTGAWVARKGGIPPLSDNRPLVMRSVRLQPVPYNCYVLTGTLRCPTFWSSH
jgi:hypothetical protein